MTWLGRDALGRVTDFSAESATTDSDDPPDITVGGGAVEQTVLARSVTLTHAQILALTLTPVEIVPAQGAGKVVYPLEGIMVFRGDTVYTNLDGSAGIGFLVGGYGMKEWSAEAILNWDEDAVLPLTPANVSFGTGVTDGGEAISNFVNQPLLVSATNGASGPFEGGAAGNTVEVTVLYTVIDV